MLSTDQNIFKAGSEVQARMIEYGQLVQELHIITYTKHNPNDYPSAAKKISNNVWAYSTNTSWKPLYFRDAYRIGKKIINQLPITHAYRQAGNYQLLITAQDPFETGLAGYLLKRKFGLPLQIQIHTDFLSPYFWQESFKNKIRVLLGKWLVKKADCLRVVSQRIKNSILRSSQDIRSCDDPNIHVLPIFVDMEKIKNAPIKTDLHKKYPGYDFIILMASRLTREKNIGMAIEAMAELFNVRTSEVQSIERSILLLIVGDGPEREALRLKAKSYNLKSNIVFESWTDDLISYYKTADLFMLTSNYEGYGRTLVEAGASGCPALTTDVGVAPEIIKFGESGIIIKPRDTKALAESILEIMRSRQNYRGRIGEGVIKNKNEYLSQYKKTFSFCSSRKN